MNADKSQAVEANYKHKELTDLIIKTFYSAYNKLGYGFLEKVYVNALVIELEKMGIKAVQQAPIPVYYEGRLVGEYFADLLVENRVIVEVKAARAISEEHGAQLLNYLKASRHEVGLLLNFGPRPEIKRKAFDNPRKGNMAWLNEAQNS